MSTSRSPTRSPQLVHSCIPAAACSGGISAIWAGNPSRLPGLPQHDGYGDGSEDGDGVTEDVDQPLVVLELEYVEQREAEPLCPVEEREHKDCEEYEQGQRVDQHRVEMVRAGSQPAER